MFLSEWHEFLWRLSLQEEIKLDANSGLDVVEIARVA
jgi:hypothetical protein